MKYPFYALALSPAFAYSFAPLKSFTASQPRTPCFQHCDVIDHGFSSSKNIFSPLSSTVGNVEDNSTPDEKMTKKIKGRKKRLSSGYTILIVGYSLFALLFARFLSPIGLYIASGMTTASGVAYILKEAAHNNRLSSDTYKRLNLALGSYGLIGVLARGTFDVSWAVKVWTLISFIGMVNCIKGFGYGLKGWELSKVDPIPEFVNGAKSTFRTLAKVPSNLKSTLYLLSTMGFSYLTVSKLLDSVRLIASSNGAITPIASRYLFRLNKLILLSAITFTLKDAADRDRLEGTTFIELNFLVAFATFTMAAYYFQTSVLGASFATITSLLSMFSGFSSLLKKRSS